MDVFEPDSNNWLGSLAKWLQQNNQPIASELVQITDLMIRDLQTKHSDEVDAAFHRARTIVLAKEAED